MHIMGQIAVYIQRTFLIFASWCTGPQVNNFLPFSWRKGAESYSAASKNDRHFIKSLPNRFLSLLASHLSCLTPLLFQCHRCGLPQMCWFTAQSEGEEESASKTSDYAIFNHQQLDVMPLTNNRVEKTKRNCKYILIIVLEHRIYNY